MSLKPRHLILIVVIFGVFAYRYFQMRRPAATSTAPAPVVVTHATPVQTPTWAAFDKANGLRDVPNEQFDPVLQDLQKQIDATTDTTKTDLSGCLTWLQFYRQGVNHPSKDTSWKDRSTRHLDGCVKYHLDTTN